MSTIVANIVGHRATHGAAHLLCRATHRRADNINNRLEVSDKPEVSDSAELYKKTLIKSNCIHRVRLVLCYMGQKLVTQTTIQMLMKHFSKNP